MLPRHRTTCQKSFLSITLLASCASLSAQQPPIPIIVDPATATQHILTNPAPYIPPIALLAHIHGDVKVQLSIDTIGHVSAATILDGQPVFVGESLDAVRQWTYRPFLKEDQPAPATTVVTLTFRDRGPKPATTSPRLPQKFMETENECYKDIQDKSHPDKALKLCTQAAIEADSVQGKAFGVVLSHTYLTAADLLLRDHQYDSAKTQIDKALALIDEGYGDLAKPCAAYTIKAESEWGLHDLVNADLDLTKAEDYETIAIAVIQSDTLKLEYTRILKNVLGLHAQPLQSAGKLPAAQEKTARAAKL